MSPTTRRSNFRPSRRRTTTARQRTRGQLLRVDIRKDAATVTAGTAVQNNMFEDIATSAGLASAGGNLIARGRMTYVARPLATGTSRIATGFLRGIASADVGDMLPATDPGQPWMAWHQLETFGQRHLVATTPTLEFDEFRRVHRHGPVRARALLDAFWFVEESVTQNWESSWQYQAWVDVS